MADRRLWVVACCYALPAREMRRALERLAARLDIEFRGVIVDNRRGELPPGDDHWAFVAGSNRDHDFSAYIEGLQCSLERRQTMPAVILFLNDSLFTTHSALLNARETVAYAPLLEQIRAAAICGKTDPYTMLCHRNPWSGVPLYVSSYCFLLNRSGWECLLELPSMAEADGLAGDRAVGDAAWGRGLPAGFREFIRSYVLYGHPAFSWPGLRRYALNDPFVAAKARCIYFEHRLTGEVGRDGCVVSINARALPRWRLYWSEKILSLLRAGAHGARRLTGGRGR